MGTLRQRATGLIRAPFRVGSLGSGVRPRDFVVTLGGLSGTTFIGTALGFPFWWLAARLFSPSAVGLASAVLAAMGLLGSIATFGLGAVLVREIPRSAGQERALIGKAIGVAGCLSAIAAIAFAFMASGLDAELATLGRPLEATVFVLGVSLASMSSVFDSALIGLLRGDLYFARNVVMALGKLGLLIPGAALVVGGAWLGIYGAWVVAIAASLVLVVLIAFARGAIPRSNRATRPAPLALAPTTLRHFGLTVTLQIPILGMPILVTVLGGAAVNASFYMAWLIGGAASILPTALSGTLYAIGSRSPEALQMQTRLTLVLSVAAAAVSAVILGVLATPLLGVFGHGYDQSSTALIAIAAASIPGVIKQHFHVLLRISGQLTRAAMVCGAGALLELAMAVAGMSWNGVTGLALAWLLAVSIEAAFMAPTVYQAIRTTGGAGAGRLHEDRSPSARDVD